MINKPLQGGIGLEHIKHGNFFETDAHTGAKRSKPVVVHLATSVKGTNATAGCGGKQIVVTAGTHQVAFAFGYG